MRGETHAEDLEIDSDVAAVDVNTLLARLHSAAVSTGHAVAWNNHCVLFEARPLLESLQAEASMEHTRRGEEHHWGVLLKFALVKLTYMGEVEHVFLDEGFLDFFIGPIYE